MELQERSSSAMADTDAFPNIFDELPVESIAHIFSFLPATHLCELSKASRQAAEVADLDIVWRPVVQREFGAHSRQQRREVEARYESIADDPVFKDLNQMKRSHSSASSFLNHFPPVFPLGAVFGCT